MRKILILLPCLLLSALAIAQNDNLGRTQMQQWLLHTMHKRDASQLYLKKNYPIDAASHDNNTNNNKKHKGGISRMPQNTWFPGEWEEVQAIVVTCYYNYLVPGHEDDYNWYADPVMTGYADYYYGYGTPQGGGPYIAVPDTSHNSFCNVFFYLMDAIQMGNAEAWVRIENASDSSIIKRRLQTMGLRNDKMRFIVGSGNSFWFRDCGPICFYYGDNDSVAMVDFEYYSGRALDDSLPALIEEQFGIPNYITGIEWEGGNCIVDGAGLVMSSDAIYIYNSDTIGQLTWNGSDPNTIRRTGKQPLSQNQVHDSLAAIMGPRGAYILPRFRYDGGTGHMDLYCEMIDENEFVFSKFPEHYSNWLDYKTATKNIDTLLNRRSIFGNNFKCHYIPFPCTNSGNDFPNQTSYNNNYTRTYSNHTFVNNVIIQPCFSNVVNGNPSLEWDRLRIDSLKAAYPGYTIYPINVTSFDGSGGAIHCITKQIPADNPVRILHPSITGNTEQLYNSTDAPIEAFITNRSGISNATLYYSFDGQPMQPVVMTANTDDTTHFTASIPTAGQLTGNSKRVDYYISAISNNGKTITKPMTAANGGYYTFWLGHHDPVGIHEIDPQQSLSLYPNPANTSITINAEGHWEKLCIVDMTGRMAYHSTFNSTPLTIDVSHLPKGLYLVVLQSQDNRIAKKLMLH